MNPYLKAHESITDMLRPQGAVMWPMSSTARLKHVRRPSQLRQALVGPAPAGATRRPLKDLDLGGVNLTCRRCAKPARAPASSRREPALMSSAGRRATASAASRRAASFAAVCAAQACMRAPALQSCPGGHARPCVAVLDVRHEVSACAPGAPT